MVKQAKEYVSNIDPEQVNEMLVDLKNQNEHAEELKQEALKDANLKKPEAAQPSKPAPSKFVDDGFDYNAAYEEYQKKAQKN